MSAIRKLKTAYCVKIILECLKASKEQVDLDVFSILQQLNIGEEKCFKVLNALICEKKWTNEALDEYVEEVIEGIENDLLNKNPEFSLEDITHQRVAVPEANQYPPQPYYWVPAVYYAYPCYYFALCYLPL